MIKKFQIRPYLSMDYSQVKSIYEESGLYDQENDSQQRLDEKISRDPTSIIVAVDEERVVGTISLMEDGRMAFMFRLAVKSTHRERGIGMALLQAADEELQRRGGLEINILVDEQNQELKDYYTNRGYKEGHSYRWMYKERK